MTEREKCLYWAEIFEKPRRAYFHGPLQTNEIDTMVAKALRFYAQSLSEEAADAGALPAVVDC